MTETTDWSPKLTKTLRTADLLCSAHAGLRDQYRALATALDVLILFASSVLVAHTFGVPELLGMSSPLGVVYKAWVAIFSVVVFGLSIIQLRVDWKAKSEAHAKSFRMYAEVKHQIGHLLASGACTDSQAASVLSRYDLAADVGTTIPEDQFLVQKQRHRIKIEISKILDAKPAMPITLIRWKLFLRDTVGRHETIE